MRREHPKPLGMLIPGDFPDASPSRGAQALVVAVVFLVVMAILGISVLTSSSGGYSAVARAAYSHKSTFLCEATAEEAASAMYLALSMPLGGTTLSESTRRSFTETRRSLLRKFLGGAGGGVLEVDLLSKGMLSVSPRLAAFFKGEIVEARARLWGFRPLKYTPDGLFSKEEIYYRDPDGLLDPDTKPVELPRDFVGYCTIDVKVACRGVESSESFTYDVKIVNQSPPAREFVLFAYGYTDPKANPSLPQDYAARDLNGGGSLQIYGNRWGRIFVRGPYMIETEGFSDGTSGGYASPWGKRVGGRPVAAVSYPNTCYPSSKKRWWWHEWALVPALRAATVNHQFMPAPARPFRRECFVQGSLLKTLGMINPLQLGWDYIAQHYGIEDLGAYIEPSVSPAWYCAWKDAAAPWRGFSILGDPASVKDEVYGFSMFRGVMGRYVPVDRERPEKGLRFRPLQEYVTPTGNWSFVPAPPEEDEPEENLYAIQPEGLLIGKCRIASFRTRDWAVIGKYYVEVDDEKEILYPYGLRWEYLHKMKWWRLLGRFVSALGLGVLTIATAGTAGFAVGALSRVVAFASSYYGSVAAVTLTGALIGAWGSGALHGGGQVSGAVPWRYYPPMFKPYERAVVRRVHSLESLVPPRPDRGDPLLLCGIYGVDSLRSDTPFFYRGKGMIVCTAGGGADGAAPAARPKIALPILPASFRMPEDPARLRKVLDSLGDDYLTVVMLDPDPAALAGGRSMLVLDCADEASSMIGSICSDQGAAPAEGKTVDIYGNLVCRLINKSRIPDAEGTALRIRYARFLYPEGLEAETRGAGRFPYGRKKDETARVDPRFTDGRWHAVTVSPRPCLVVRHGRRRGRRRR